MKTCSKCKIEYPATVEYFKLDKRKKLGLSSHCRQCTKQVMANYYQNNKEKVNAYTKRYREQNPESGSRLCKESRQNNPERTKALKALTRKRIKHATPDCPIIQKEIKDIYLNCPKGLTVDHIAPLKGKNVRGFHVPWNLQYLTKSENSSKGNKFEPYIESLRG